MENLELAYESRGSRNYLSVKATDELSAFQAKMLENNQIPCLLPMRSRSMNGVYCLDYDITGMSRLVDALESRQLRGSKAKKMLWELLDGLLGTEEYFLTYAQCVLELDYIYFSDDEKIGLVYLPLKNAEITDQETVKGLFQDLLVNYLADENEQFFMDLLRYVNKREFSVPGLYKLVKDAVDMPAPVVQQPVTEEKPKAFFGKPAAAPQAPAPMAAAPMAAPEPPKQKSLFSKPASAPVAAPAPAPAAPVTPPPAAPAGFAIPGAGPAIPPAAPAPAKQEKKPLFSFSGGAKKEKPAAPAGNVPPMGAPMGGKVPPMGGNVPPMAPPPMGQPQRAQGVPPMAPPPAAPAPAQPKAKGSLFGNKPATPAAPAMPATPSPMAAPMQNQAPMMNAAPAADQWKGTVMMSNDLGGGKTIMMGMGGSFPCLRHAGNTINLDHFPFMIGKQNADYVISKGVISRTHATIINKNGSYYIKDENSSNHTYVNGAQIPPFTECEIFSGDRIRLADEEMEFSVEG